MSSHSENRGGRRRRPVASSRRGGALKVVVVLLLILGVGAGVVGWRMKASKATKKVNLIFAPVERGDFIYEVNGKGSAESASNVDVASQVEGQATVIYLIPEGTDVKKGDLLVELDSSDVDEKLDSQIVQTNTSRATLNSSRASLRSAQISLEEYVEGTFEQSWMEYENTIFEAEQTRKQQADSAKFTERLLNLNYSTELQLEIDKVAEEKAKNSLEVANLKKNTLLKYTSEKQITSLMSDIETARAKVDSDKNSYNINLNRENRYRAISANCKIKAPQDGQVVYANQDSRRMSESEMIKEGSTVRQRQVLIRLPDKTQMQVRTMINESNISSVKAGMPAKITFDSIPGRVIEGEVVKVNLYPEIVWMSSAKDYVTLVKIMEDDIEELRSGLTAQVRIIADEQHDVLMVPVHCVTEFGNKTYCVTYNDGVWGCKEVLLGASNEKQVIVLEGLEEGELVVSGARNYRDNVKFPDPNEPSLFENNEIYQQKLAEKKAEEEKNAEIEAGGGAENQVAGGLPGAGGFSGAAGGFAGGQGGAGGMPSGAGGFTGGGSGDGVGGRPGGRGGRPGGAGGFPGGGDPQALLAGLAERIKSGDVPQEILANIPPGILESIKNGESLSASDLEEKRQREEEAAEYAKTIEENLARDVKVAAVESFFGRTVMEMHRELLSAISDKATVLQERVATRQSEITRRQEEIELLQKTAQAVESGAVQVMSVEGGEDSDAKIARLTDEIKTLRGDSDVPTLDRVVYLDKVDWSKYVSGNDLTREGIDFLTQDSDEIFNQLFPNSSPVDVVKAASTTAEDAVETDDEDDWMKDTDATDSKAGVATVDYTPFKALFADWDTSGDGRLKPTEFVIGFFSDRKSFQNSESDDEIEKLFAEYAPRPERAADGSEAEEVELVEIPMTRVAEVADRILRERATEESGSSRRGGRRGGRGGFPGVGQAGFPGGGAQGGLPGGGGSRVGQDQSVAPADAQSGPRGDRDGAPVAGQGEAGERPAAPNGDATKPEDATEGKAVDVATPGFPRVPNEPIKSLAEANSARQAVALYVDRMDFNGDGLLQKTEFVKGYHDVKDVSGKLFASTTLVNATDSGAGGFGPPPR